MVALGRIVLNKRERVIALEPHGKGILAGLALLYPYEVRKADEHFEDIPDVEFPRARCSSSPSTSLTPRAADFDPSTFEDHYETGADRAVEEEAGRVRAAEGQGGRGRAA